MKGRKALRRLNARIKDFDQKTQGLDVNKGSNFHKPGSLKR